MTSTENNGKITIIAEIGVNHNGSLIKAKELTLAARNSGADAVKFQLYRTENLVRLNTKLAPYQSNNVPEQEDQYSMLEKLELSQTDIIALAKYCKEIGVIFIASVFDLESLNLYNSLKSNYIKIPSGEITNSPLLHEIAKTNYNILMSTGMASLEEIKLAIEILLNGGILKEKITLLHTTTSYPTSIEEVNLNRIFKLKSTFGLNIGFSDHTISDSAAIMALAIGSRLFEKHITLDTNDIGPDHKASLDVIGFSKYTKSIHDAIRVLGSSDNLNNVEENANKFYARKSIVANGPIKIGEKFTNYNLNVKRPASGISPIFWKDVIGTSATRNYEKDDDIEW
jgi:N,N'-diacetyllegionaminate synthase